MDLKIWILRVPLLLMFGEFISHCCSFSTGESNITANQSLVDGHVLVSPGGIFALGFFRPGNSSHRYVGIWFDKAPKQSVVWVANRGNPIGDACGILSFDATQNLVLTCNSSKNTTPIWSTNITRTTKGGVPNYSVMGKLLDIGNFVLLQQETQKVIWQSFDYPTHTKLPYMKVGYDPRTRVNRTLTSWKSEDDPGPGSCSYGLDPTGVPQLTLNKGSNRVWRGGPWNGLGWSGVPKMNNIDKLNYSYVDTPDEISTMHSFRVNSSTASRIVVYETGLVQHLRWKPGNSEWWVIWHAPKDLCDSYGRCGKYSYCDPNVNMSDFECKCLPGFRPRSIQDWERREGKGGCVRERGLDTACGNGAGFKRLPSVKVPDTNVARKNMSLSGKACEQECLRDCTCVAYTSAILSPDGRENGCITWHGDLVDIKLYPENGGQDLYVKVDAVELVETESARKGAKGLHGAQRLWVMVTLPIFLTALILLLCYRISKFRGHAKRRNHKTLLLEDHKMMNLPFFNMREMKSATANFSNKLGQGGFGPVFKGQLPNGQEIAVKRLSKHSCQGAEEFKNEVLLIARLQHRNLVKLLGCCIDEEETMLIYEYMPNKSLDSFIFDDSKKVLLDWKRRYEIIIGIARGILYLHQDSRLKIVHRDLKTSNILLDAEMIPKISDFGMARIFGGSQNQANTKRIVGTFGYMSPEYALDGIFSIKSDVFSFGVILLEIITGKRNHSLYNDNPLLNLIRYIWDLWREGRVLEIVDASWSGSWQEDEVLRYVQVGLLCVQENATDRPTISTIIFMLSNEVSLPYPKQPAFAIRRNTADNALGSSTSGSSSHSNNKVTISMLEPR